jgi:cytidylate kinase
LKYLDTGAMYRAVTWIAIEEGVDPEDSTRIGRIAENIDLELETGDGETHLARNGESLSDAIRGPEVSGLVSQISRQPAVRSAMVRLQRRIASTGGIVAEGRDTGTTVFPFAHIKIFLVAGIDERTSRRVKQLGQMGIEQSGTEVKENLSQRDEIDSNRQHSPLKKPAGSFLVDTSGITINEQVSIIEDLVRKEAERLAGIRIFDKEKNPFEKKRFYYNVSWHLVRFLARVIFGMKIYGEENIRFRENFIFASNHVSYADPPLIGCAIKREIWFVAKKELFKNKLLGWLIRTYHAIPIDREGMSRTTVKTVKKCLDTGESVLIFPEGRRSRSGKLMDVKSGIGLMVFHSSRNLVPTYISGSNNLKDCFWRRRRLEVRLGPPIRIPPGYEPDDRKAEYSVLSSMIQEELRMLEYESKT